MKMLIAVVFIAMLSPALAAQPPAPTDSSKIQIDADGQIDPGARWQTLFGNTDVARLYATFEIAGKVANRNGGVDADACKANSAAIDEALKVNTVGLGLWYAAYRCALAVHDDATAEQRLQVFSALVRYALDSTPQDLGETPIRVLSEQDIEAFIAASGQELLYVYYDFPSIGRYLPVNVALWDAERKRERLLHFDFLDSRLRLLHNDPQAGFPAYRMGAALGFIRALGQSPGSWAAPMFELTHALNGGGNAIERMAKFETSAHNGNFSAAMAYALVCQIAKIGDCATQSIELILPWAEKSYSMALITLALAYDQGNGVKRNSDYAQKLIETADRRLGDARASVLFAGLSLLRSKQESAIAPWVRKTVENAADQQVPSAELMHVALETMHDGGKKLRPKSLAMLGNAAAAGLPRAQSLLGVYLIENGNASDGLRWIQAAAAAGETGAQNNLAHRYERGEGVEKNLELAKKWSAEAGRGGDRSAMLWMAGYYRDQPANAQNLRARAGWLESAMNAGSVDAALLLGSLYQEGGDGAPGSEKEAMAIYRILDQRQNNAEARRRLARLLIYSKTIDHDLVEARRLLQVDVDRGDIHARVDLGHQLVGGVWGKEHVEEGMQMLEKAAKEGSAEALIEYGFALYFATPPRRKEALSQFQQAADKGSITAANNLAWAYCTAPEPDLIDAKRGLELTEKLESASDRVRYLDTIAACHANAGDFIRAISVAQEALVKALTRAPVREKSIAEGRERIELYRRNKPYRETSPADVDG